MLFEHSSTPSDPPDLDGADTEFDDHIRARVTDLAIDERAVILRGLHECDRGRHVDALAADLVHSWPRLKPEERCATLNVIAALLAADVAEATQLVADTSTSGGRPS